MQALFWFLIVIIGYCLGNINGAIIISKCMMKDDVRSHGSGNAGLTNFFRTYGGFQSLLVIAIDVGKCVLACLIAVWLLPEQALRAQLRQKELPEEAPTLLMSTALGLAPLAYGVTGARVLRNTSWAGAILHIGGGALGLALMLTLVIVGALYLISPVNMFLYQLIWMIPALLITEWARII